MDGLLERKILEAVSELTYEVVPEQLGVAGKPGRARGIVYTSASKIGLKKDQWPSALVLRLGPGTSLKFARGNELADGYEYELLDGVTRVSSQKILVFKS